MTTPHFYRTATSHGDVFRANFAGCDLELGPGKDWLHIITLDGTHETWEYRGGAWAFAETSHDHDLPTQDWTDQDHANLEAAIAIAM